MKAILTIFLVLFCGFAALANTNEQPISKIPKIEKHDEIKFSQMDPIVDSGIIVVTEYNEIETTGKNEITRLYKFKNSRIKKALAFSTKRNKAKIA